MIKKILKECDSSCEYVLPDYLGDVKKLISSSARAVPSGQFNTETGAECSGIVAYEIVYLDSENKLSSASFSSDYDFSFHCDGDGYVDSYVSTEAANFSIRLTGPRRIVAKANLVSDILIVERWEPSVGGDGFSASYAPEKIGKTLKIENALWGSGGEREYAEEAATIEGVSPEELEIISSSAVVRISESVPVEGGVNIKGVLSVTALVRTPETSVFAVRRDIPFDETVPIESVLPGASASAEAIVSSVTCGVSESENASRISVNAIMELRALLRFNENVEVVNDAYVKTRDSVPTYERLCYTECVCAESREGSIQVKIPKSAFECASLKEILSINCAFRGVKAKPVAKGLEISCDALFSGVACEINENGTDNIIPIKYTAPVEFVVNLSCQNQENFKYSLRISPAFCEWDIDGDEISVKASFGYGVSVAREMSDDILTSLEIVGEGEYTKSLSTIRVYFPDDNETLFDIARKFHTSAMEIAEDNNIVEKVSEFGELSRGFGKLIIR